MRVLLVNHTSTVSGAEHSLLGLLNAMPAGVDATLACPPGPLADEAIRAGVRVDPLPQTDGSLKLHPRHTATGVASLVRSAWRIRALAAEHGADVVHANSIRAGLSANLATRLGAPPAVVHVRDCLPPGRVSSVLQRSVRRRSAAVVANSRYTLERFGCADGGFVVHNAVDPVRFSPRTATRVTARSDLGIEPGRPVLGVVAQLTPWKGQDVAIRALIRVRESYPDAVLLLAGAAKFTAAATRHDNLTYVNGLHELVRSAGLEESVLFLGERSDVPSILAALDLLLLPSWEEPFGRAVIEAFAMGVPAIATDVGGTAEVITEGSDGLLRPPRDPDAWADAIVSLLGQPALMRAMGDRARDAALRRFTPEDHGQAIAAVYEHVAGDRAPARRERPIFV